MIKQEKQKKTLTQDNDVCSYQIHLMILLYLYIE